jgi:hypothetical protein
VEANADRRRGRHLGRRANPDPAHPRRRSVHDVLGFQTACPRPLAGQGVWELLERAGNYGVPLAFLRLLGSGRSLGDWLSFRPAPPLTLARAAAISWILRVTTALLLIGHGGFDFAMGKDWIGYAAAVGVSPAVVAAHPFSPMAEWFECALRLIVLAWPASAALLFVFAWKLASEAFRPLAGEPIWEFTERAGSYGAPLALAWLQRRREGRVAVVMNARGSIT